MRLYRVFPWLETAGTNEPGHPLYVPVPQGTGRVDNPEHYRVLYASDAPEGAVAERFGNHAIWTDALLAGPPFLPGSTRALGTYEADLEALDLDDARNLLDLELRPSQVVTRDRGVTQAWALRVYRTERWDGVRWWSYWDPGWGSFGIWRPDSFETTSVEPLRRDHPAVEGARAVLARVWQ
jgi:hypothetical protein